MGNHALALLAALDTACRNVDEFGQASAELFQTHPDYAIIASFPGLVASTGTRVLTEIEDDRTRFADARALKPASDPHLRACSSALLAHSQRVSDRTQTSGNTSQSSVAALGSSAWAATP
jgi:hypothetical protein